MNPTKISRSFKLAPLRIKPKKVPLQPGMDIEPDNSGAQEEGAGEADDMAALSPGYAPTSPLGPPPSGGAVALRYDNDNNRSSSSSNNAEDGEDGSDPVVDSMISVDQPKGTGSVKEVREAIKAAMREASNKIEPDTMAVLSELASKLHALGARNDSRDSQPRQQSADSFLRSLHRAPGTDVSAIASSLGIKPLKEEDEEEEGEGGDAQKRKKREEEQEEAAAEEDVTRALGHPARGPPVTVSRFCKRRIDSDRRLQSRSELFDWRDGFYGRKFSDWQVTKRTLLASLGGAKDELRTLLLDLEGAVRAQPYAGAASVHPFQPIINHGTGPFNGMRFSRDGDRGSFDLMLSSTGAAAGKRHLHIAIGYAYPANTAVEIDHHAAVAVNVFVIDPPASHQGPMLSRYVHREAQVVFLPSQSGHVFVDWSVPPRALMQKSDMALACIPVPNDQFIRGLICTNRRPPFSSHASVDAMMKGFLRKLPLAALELSIRTFALPKHLVDRSEGTLIPLGDAGTLWPLHNGIPHCARFIQNQLRTSLHIQMLKLCVYVLTMDCLRMEGVFGAQHRILPGADFDADAVRVLMADEIEAGVVRASQLQSSNMYDLIHKVMYMWHVHAGTFPFAMCKQTLCTAHDYHCTQFGLEALLDVLIQAHLILTADLPDGAPMRYGPAAAHHQHQHGVEARSGAALSRALLSEASASLENDPTTRQIMLAAVREATFHQDPAAIEAKGSNRNKQAPAIHSLEKMFTVDSTMTLQCGVVRLGLTMGGIKLKANLGRAAMSVLPYWRGLQAVYLHSERCFRLDATHAVSPAPLRTPLRANAIAARIEELKAAHWHRHMQLDGGRRAPADDGEAGQEGEDALRVDEHGGGRVVLLSQVQVDAMAQHSESRAALRLRELKTPVAHACKRPDVFALIHKAACLKLNGQPATAAQWEAAMRAAQPDMHNLDLVGSVVELSQTMGKKFIQLSLTLCGADPLQFTSKSLPDPEALALGGRGRPGGPPAHWLAGQALQAQERFLRASGQAGLSQARDVLGAIHAELLKRDSRWSQQQVRFMSALLHNLGRMRWANTAADDLDTQLRQFAAWNDEAAARLADNGRFRKLPMEQAQPGMGGEDEAEDPGRRLITLLRQAGPGVIEQANGGYFARLTNIQNGQSGHRIKAQLWYLGPVDGGAPVWTGLMLQTVDEGNLHYWVREGAIGPGRIERDPNPIPGQPVWRLVDHYGYRGLCLNPNNPTPPGAEFLTAQDMRRVAQLTGWRLISADGVELRALTDRAVWSPEEEQAVMRPSNYWLNTRALAATFYQTAHHQHPPAPNGGPRLVSGPPQSRSVPSAFGGLLAMPFPPRSTLGLNITNYGRDWESHYQLFDGVFMDAGRSAHRYCGAAPRVPNLSDGQDGAVAPRLDLLRNTGNDSFLTHFNVQYQASPFLSVHPTTQQQIPTKFLIPTLDTADKQLKTGFHAWRDTAFRPAGLPMWVEPLDMVREDPRLFQYVQAKHLTGLYSVPGMVVVVQKAITPLSTDATYDAFKARIGFIILEFFARTLREQAVLAMADTRHHPRGDLVTAVQYATWMSSFDAAENLRPALILELGFKTHPETKAPGTAMPQFTLPYLTKYQNWLTSVFPSSNKSSDYARWRALLFHPQSTIPYNRSTRLETYYQTQALWFIVANWEARGLYDEQYKAIQEGMDPQYAQTCALILHDIYQMILTIVRRRRMPYLADHEQAVKTIMSSMATENSVNFPSAPRTGIVIITDLIQATLALEG